MQAILLRFGYAILFLGVAVEGEGFLIGASFLARLGYFRLPLVIAVATLANCAADQVYYVLARLRGRAWMEKRFAGNPRYRQGIELMRRHARLLLFVSRYVFGFRIIIPAACGVLEMPTAQFTTINIAAGLIWAIPMALAGYYFGRATEQFLYRAREYEFIVVGLLLSAAVVYLIARYVRERKWFGDFAAADLHAVLPIAMGVVGVTNLLSAIWFRPGAGPAAFRTWLPLEVTQGSRPLMLFAGIALLQVTRNLSRRKELAWYVATIALAISFALHLTRRFRFHHSIVAALLLAYLFYFRKRFYAVSDRTSLKLALAMGPVLAASVFAYGYIGLREMQTSYQWASGNTVVKETLRSGILIDDPDVIPQTRRAARFLESVQVTGWIARFYLLVLVLRPVILRKRLEAPEMRIDEIFRRFGDQSLAAFAIQDDKHHLLVDGDAFVAYATHGRVALACGDPLVSDGEFEAAMEDYMRHTKRNGWTTCVYYASQDRLPHYHRLGLKSLKVAEEAIVDLSTFGLTGGQHQNLRAMMNKAARSGLRVIPYDRQRNPSAALDEQLEAVSEEWLSERRLGEMGFTMGRFSLESLSRTRVFIALMGDRAVSFCTWLPYRNGSAVALDLMRKRSEAPAGTMDFLLGQSLLFLKSEGLVEASLGHAPLANVQAPTGALERGVALLFENLNAFYGYKNLFQFKKKFAPRWRGRYLVYPTGADLPAITYAMAAIHSSSGLLALLFRR
jgi:phosphatidylglycerol lysyltransferase